jgi:hypothetical protein
MFFNIDAKDNLLWKTSHKKINGPLQSGQYVLLYLPR